MEYVLEYSKIEEFKKYLKEEERSNHTIEKYMQNIKAFYRWSDHRLITKALVMSWKEYLVESGLAPVTINASLASLHSFFTFMDWGDCRVKYLKIQKKVFRDASKELTKYEYRKLVDHAVKSGNQRLALAMETICGTGIRVSEIQYITVEAAKKGRADISLKGKIRTILIPGKLAKKLLTYAKKNRIKTGEIFLTANKKGLSRRQLWGEMKRLCKTAGIDGQKVFPHNLRHLFARSYYKISKDLVKLADVMGHSSIGTTRIYLLTTGTEHMQELNRLGLVV